MAGKKTKVKEKGKDYYIAQLRKLGVEITDDNVKTIKAEQLAAKEPVLEPELPGETGYHCGNCQALISRNEASCGSCGEPLDWSAIV